VPQFKTYLRQKNTVTLHKQGASRGATLAFIIATPAISITAIILAIVMVDWQFTSIYIATALIVAIGTSLIALRIFDKKERHDYLLETNRIQFTVCTISPTF